MINSPSSVYSNDTLKEVSEQQHSEKSIDIATNPMIKKRQKNNEGITIVGEEQNQENQNENSNEIIVNRRRKKKLMIS